QLLEGLDPAGHPAVAAALKDLRAQWQAIEDKRRRDTEAAARQQARAVPDEDATRVILLPEIAQMQAAVKAPPDVGGATMISNGAELPSGPVQTAAARPRQAPSSTQSTADNQKRLMVLAGVLFLLLLFALVLLRFAP